jgi:acyl-CoA thioester hydrolase
MNSPLVNRTVYRVIYGDTDQMGVVYYANYLRWFERGRSEFLRQIGRPYPGIEKDGYHFPVVEAQCRYHQSAHYDDEIEIETMLSEVSRASLRFSYRITRPTDRTLLAEGTTRHACIDSSGKAIRLPADLHRRLAGGSLQSDE